MCRHWGIQTCWPLRGLKTLSQVCTPVLAKHTKSFNLVDTLSVGVGRIQRNFESMQRRVESWRETQITHAQSKLIFYAACVDIRTDWFRAAKVAKARAAVELVSCRAAFHLYEGFTDSELIKRFPQQATETQT
jgi:hypothetical protein